MVNRHNSGFNRLKGESGNLSLLAQHNKLAEQARNKTKKNSVYLNTRN